MGRNLRILHVIDDDKFISFCQKTFDLDGLENLFSSSENFRRNWEDQEFDVVVLHSLNIIKAKILNSQVISVPVIWFFWGADAFRLGKFHSKFLLPRTNFLRLKLAFKQSLRSGLRELIRTVNPKSKDKEKKHKTLINSLSKINIIVPVVPGDYFLLKNNYSIKASMFHLNYANAVLDEEKLPRITNNNILVGNSASFTNNHIEIIEKLTGLNLEERKVIIPLNYGNERYGDHIQSFSKKKLGENAIPLRTFLPYAEYQKILSSCSIVILNHLRQQAMGNVIQGIWNGAHLYVNKKTTLCHFLHENEFLFSTIDNLRVLRDLNEDERDYNRRKCNEVFGTKQQHKKVKKLIDFTLRKTYEKNSEEVE